MFVLNKRGKEKNPLLLVRMLLMSRGIRSWIPSMFREAPGNGARNKDQNPGTCSHERNEDIPRQGSCRKQRGSACDTSEALGNCCVVLKINVKG